MKLEIFRSTIDGQSCSSSRQLRPLVAPKALAVTSPGQLAQAVSAAKQC